MAFPSTAGGWVDFLSAAEIPVLRRTAAALERLRARAGEVDARSLGVALGPDPFVAMRVFAHLARLRPNQGAEVTTVDRAVMMIGIPPFLAAFCGLQCVEERLADQRPALAGLLALLRRSYRAARFALRFAVWRNDAGAQEIMLAARLHDCAEMLLWCCAPQQALRVKQALAAAPGVRSRVVQRALLGVELGQLQIALARRWRLPELLVAMMDDAHADNPRVKNVMLAVRLARHSARSWSDPAVPDDLADIGALLSTTPRHALELARGEDVRGSA